MKTPKPEGPQEPGNNRKQKPNGAKPRRGTGSNTVGFGNVMRDVRGGKHGAGGEGGAAGGVVLTPGMAGFDQAAALAAQANPGNRVAHEMGAVRSGEELANDASMGIQDATEALAAQDRSISHQSSAQPFVPTPLGRMTPSALLETVLDEATMLEIEQASKELHVELEPADLGPLIVRLRKGPDGTLDIRFLAREGEAARVLESGSELLRDRLAAAGFASVSIDVRHDAELRLTGITTGR